MCILEREAKNLFVIFFQCPINASLLYLFISYIKKIVFGATNLLFAFA